MIPIDQTGFIPFVDGNCFSACIASILEMPLEDVPLFYNDEGINNWYDKFDNWCKENGYWASYYSIEDMGDDWCPDDYSILSGQSPRGDWLHSVVAYGNEIVHDPHPDKSGIISRLDWIILGKK